MSWKKIWHFIWKDNSIWSWIVNVIIAFILIKFLILPGLGLIFSTSHPLVAVVSSSMEHSQGFDHFWSEHKVVYENLSITLQDFKTYPFQKGFNRGDIMILKGRPPEKIKIGDVMVFASGKQYPIIHRVVKKWQEKGQYFFQTKGDNNYKSIKATELNEMRISEDQIIGVAIAKIPYVGLIKVWAADGWKAIMGIK